MTVSVHGVPSRRSPSQSKPGSTTNPLGIAVGVVLVVGLEVGDVGVVGDVGQRARLVPQDLALDRLRVRVDEQLAGVEAVALLGLVRAVDAVAVALAGADAGQVAVPVVGRALDHLDARLDVLGAVEQAQLDALGVLAEEAEVRPAAVPRRAERERAAGPDLELARSSSSSQQRSAEGGQARPCRRRPAAGAVGRGGEHDLAWPAPAGTARGASAKLHGQPEGPAVDGQPARLLVEVGDDLVVGQLAAHAPTVWRRAPRRASSRSRVSLERSNVAGSCGSGTSSPANSAKAANSRRRPSRVAMAISSSMWSEKN